MKILQGFKDFAMRCNVMDMAIDVVIGGTLKSIIDTLVIALLNTLLCLLGSQNLNC